jgi:peptidoglycan/LPS O-acetylase OafA/YrhL
MDSAASSSTLPTATSYDTDFEKNSEKPSAWFDLDPVVKSSRLSLPSLSLPSIPTLSQVVRQLRHLPQWLSSKKRRRPNVVLRPTAYLDGLRGFAALLVYILHTGVWARGGGIILENVFGFNEQYYFATLPFIRTFFSGGHLAVAVFFVISGYVLSAKPLSLIQKGDHAKLAESLGSSLFRRWLRLFLPLFATTFITMTLDHFIPSLTWSRDSQPYYIGDIKKFVNEFKTFSFLFRPDGLVLWFSYNFHTWTIPLELRGSIMVYTTVPIFATLSKNSRLLYQAGLAFFLLVIVDCWWASCFVAGMLLCDLDLLAQANQLPSFFTPLEKHKKTIFTIFFIIGLYLGGVTTYTDDKDDVRKSPGWYYLSFLVPATITNPKSFFLTIAGVLIVASVSHLSWLRKTFELPFMQYLGRISYCLYLVHGPVLEAVGERVYAMVGWYRPSQDEHIPRWVNIFPLPKWGPYGMEFSLIAVHCFLLPFTLWVSDLATTFIDEPAVNFAWRLQKWAAPPSASPASTETELLLHRPQGEQLVM